MFAQYPELWKHSVIFIIHFEKKFGFCKAEIRDAV